MKNSEGPEKSDGLTRRGFLGRISLGLVGIAGLGISLGSLLSSGSEANSPGDGLPEDSIFRPRKDAGADNDTSDKV